MFAKSVLCLNTVKIFQLATGRTERLINGLITNIWERKSQAVIFSVLSSTETKHTFYIPTKFLCIVRILATLVVKFQRRDKNLVRIKITLYRQSSAYTFL